MVPTQYIARTFGGIAGVLLVIVGSIAFTPQSGSSSTLHTADRLRRDGHTSEAFHLYTAIKANGALPPAAQLKLAGLALERGECGNAELLAAQVIRNSNSSDDIALAHFVRGQCAAQRNQLQKQIEEWQAIPQNSRYHTLAQVLQGEDALRRGDTQAAQRFFDHALRQFLPQPWTAFVHLRLALLRADTDFMTARWHLAAIPLRIASPAPASRPFLPLHPSAIKMEADNLRTMLAVPAEQRPQLLGQYLLEAKLYQPAIERFEQIELDGPDGVRAHAYAAYTYGLRGQRHIAKRTLETLAERFPSEPLVATLQATLALEANDLPAAAKILDAAEMDHPLDPAFSLVRSDLLEIERRYAEAIAERRRARAMAQPEQRGIYALALAKQHLSTTYNLCSDGIEAAQEASTLLPHDSRAWQVLAAAHYHCRAYSEAIDAAQQGLEHTHDDPALLFYLGASLWESGQREQGRNYLLRAADRAPASQWRKQAEKMLNSYLDKITQAHN